MGLVEIFSDRRPENGTVQITQEFIGKFVDELHDEIRELLEDAGGV